MASTARRIDDSRKPDFVPSRETIWSRPRRPGHRLGRSFSWNQGPSPTAREGIVRSRMRFRPGLGQARECPLMTSAPMMMMMTVRALVAPDPTTGCPPVSPALEGNPWLRVGVGTIQAHRLPSLSISFCVRPWRWHQVSSSASNATGGRRPQPSQLSALCARR